jgi:hypothetical protein
MAPNPKPRSSVRLPLWIIAISLLVIAICLIVRTLQNEGERENRAETPASQPTADEAPARKSDLPSGVRTSRHPTASAMGAPVETETATVNGEPSTAGELSTISATADSASPIPGGFAPIAPATNATGEIVGRVTLHGRPPPERKIDLNNDSFCAQLHPEGLMTRTFVVSSNGGLANAIVFIQDPAVKTRFPAPTAPLEIHFTNCQIEPFISVATTGQVINFQNDEPVMHRVVIDLSPGGEKTTFTLRPGTNGHSLTLDTRTRNRDVRYPSAFPFVCSVHPWEAGIVVPFEHPYAAVTDDDGRFTISNVPPGKYSLEVIHLAATGSNIVVHSILVSPGQITAANFTLEAPRR